MTDTFNDGVRAAIDYHKAKAEEVRALPRGAAGEPSVDATVIGLWHSQTAIDLTGLLKRTPEEIAADLEASTRRAT